MIIGQHFGSYKKANYASAAPNVDLVNIFWLFTYLTALEYLCIIIHISKHFTRCTKPTLKIAIFTYSCSNDKSQLDDSTGNNTQKKMYLKNITD